MLLTKNIEKYEYIKQNIENLEISSKIIGSYSFCNSKIKKLILLEGIEIIGDKAFFSNELKIIYLPSTIKHIGLFSFNQTNIVYKNHLINGNVVNQYDNFIEVAQKIYSIIPNFDFNKTSSSIVKEIYNSGEYLKAYYYNLKVFNKLKEEIKRNLNINYINEFIVFKLCVITGFFTVNMNNSYSFLCEFTKSYTISDVVDLVENIKELRYYPSLSKLIIKNINNDSFRKIFVEYFNNYSKINKIINRKKSYLINQNVINKKYGRTYEKINKEITVTDILEFFSNKFNINSNCSELKKIMPLLLAYVSENELSEIEKIFVYSKSIRDNDKYFKPLEESEDNYTYKWLGGSEVLNIIAGYLTDSCARFGDDGYDIIKESMTNPLVKTMVMYYGNKMIAKSTCFYNIKYKSLIFNTFCINKDFYKKIDENKRSELLCKLINGIMAQANDMEKRGYKVENIRVGTEFNLLLFELRKNCFEETSDTYNNFPFKSDNARKKQIILRK